MRIELANLEKGNGDFAQVYQPDELNLGDERASLCSPAFDFRKDPSCRYELFIDGNC
jgi:hypothetical protein